MAVNSFANQAQYFYDELGRLSVVVDADKNVAVYNYDAVGNLLSIDRFAQGSGSIGIYTLSPSSGVVGTQVDIRGFGFSTTPADNQVAFNGQAASVLTSTVETIRAVVPANATTGPVTVTNTNGTATSPKPFTVLLPPRILGVDPNQVPQGTTYGIIIAGDNLSKATAVQFTQAGISASIVGMVSQGLRMNVTVLSTVPVGSYPFSVTTPVGVADSGVIMISVRVPAQGFSTGPPVSALMPSPSQVKPSGTIMTVAPPASAFMPGPSQVSPSGSIMTVAPPVSAEMPVLPVISGVAATNISSATVTITWTTDIASDSQVEYGTTTSYGSSSPLNSTMVTAHSVALSGFSPATLYHYRVKSRDSAGGLATSGDFTFTTAASNPDLIETSVSNPPAAAAPSGTFPVTDTAKNQGTLGAGASTTRYYLSIDTVKDGGDILLTGTRSVAALAAGATSTGTVNTVTVPSATALATYYLLACADNLSTVTEANETNNCLASTTTVQVTRPDLIETAVTNPPTAAPPSGTFPVTDTAKNQGAVNAAASTTRFYLSLDTVKDAGDKLLTGARSVVALTAGATSSGTVTVTIPSNTTLATYYLLACSDNTTVVVETNETNNCLASGTTVQVTRPDLIETAVSNPPASAIRGSGFSVTDTAQNTGAVSTVASTTTRYYLSLDTTKGSGDKLLTGTRSVGTLAAGATSTGPVTVTIPTSTTLATYFLLACSDDTAVVVETNETNNCKASAGTVIVGP